MPRHPEHTNTMFFKLIAAPLTGLLLSLTFFLPNYSYASNAPNSSSYQNKLDRLQKSIAAIQEHINDTKGRRGNILTELKKLESNISKNSRELKLIRQKLASSNQNIKKLQKDIAQLDKQINARQIILSEQIRSSYKLGSQQNIKMLLNQQNPAELGRAQVYFNYLNRERKDEIAQFMQSLENKNKKEQELAQSRLRQEKTATEKQTLEKGLQKKRLTRNQMLKQLDDRINNQEQTLSDLETSRSKIEGLLSSLAPLMADIPLASDNIQPFNEQKGQLPWPVKGPFLANYGKPKLHGDLKWNGVLIGSDYGTPVRAISHGHVAYSDWLQGFGFITIINHGEGYMSLYGHNESLFKQVGDWVNASEVIATAGDSGGRAGPALYFEVRSNGKPVNPTQWCSSKVSHLTP